MPTNGPRHLQKDQPVHLDRPDDEHVVVETPEHEVIELEGCSPDEVQAKLHDLETWVS